MKKSVYVIALLTVFTYSAAQAVTPVASADFAAKTQAATEVVKAAKGSITGQSVGILAGVAAVAGVAASKTSTSGTSGTVGTTGTTGTY